MNLQSWLDQFGDSGALLLGASDFPGGAASWLAEEPSETVELQAGDEEGLRQALRRHRGGTGGWVGFISYEFGLPFVHEEPGAHAWPAAMLRYYPDLRRLPTEAIDAGAPTKSPQLPLRPEDSEALHAERIRTLRERLVAGDVYEANLTRRFRGPAVEPRDLFRSLAQHAPAPYAAWFNTPAGAIVSNSPEAFLHLDAEGRVSTFPIKGTRPRHGDAERDEVLRRELRQDKKELAEHLMVVDLLRNDLGRVCRAGSVHCGELFEVVAYPGLWHMVTRISGRLRPEIDRASLLAQTLPAGSITGAPKRAAVQQIQALEAGPRGPYCGVFVVAPDDGSMTASVLIRTALCGPDDTVVQAGGGIVLGSKPDAECRETWLKLRNFTGAAAAGEPMP